MNTSALWRPCRQKKSHKNRKTVWEEVVNMGTYREWIEKLKDQWIGKQAKNQ